jgi:SGNH hydrolase-like domain, acetyltransferase AlgX
MERTITISKRGASEQLQDPPDGTSTRGRRVLLVVASFVFALFLLEFPALINLVDYRTILGFAQWEALSRSDPGLLQIHRPYAHSSGVSRGGDAAMYYRLPPTDLTLFQWDVKYDQNGFRNDLDLKTADMIVIGDSFVEDIPTPTAQLMTSLLAHRRSETVANLGQIAYGPQQELIVLKRYGLPLKPHIVVWMFFEGNDLTDVVHYRTAMQNQRSLWQDFQRRSFTVCVLKLVKHRFFTTDERPPGVRRAGVVQGAGKTPTVYFLNPSAPLSGQDLDALDETTRIIATSHKLCAAQGARLVFVFIPDKFRVFHNLCSFPEASECRNWTVNDLPERMRRAVTSIASDIGYLDLTSHFAEAVKKGQLPYYADDAHWSPEGHRVAADEINDYLSSTLVPLPN